MILILTTRSHEREVRIWVPSLIYIISDGTALDSQLSHCPPIGISIYTCVGASVRPFIPYLDGGSLL